MHWKAKESGLQEGVRCDPYVVILVRWARYGIREERRSSRLGHRQIGRIGPWDDTMPDDVFDAGNRRCP